MSASTLGVVPTGKTQGTHETIGKRIVRLQAEARAMANEHITELQDALETVHRLSAEIAGGGAAYPVGVREIARRLADESEGKAHAIEAVVRRGRPTIAGGV